MIPAGQRLARMLALSALVVLVVMAAFFCLVAPSEAPIDSLEGKRNALWMGHRWFTGKVTAADIDALVSNLDAHAVGDVFIHVGPLDCRGQLTETAPPAWATVRNRLKAKGVRLFAWMGGVTRWSYGEAPDTIDAARPEVRRGIITTAQALVDEAHFDGVQYDLEITPDGDAGFLALLDESREALRGTPISVATPNLRPPWLLVAHLWTRDYFTEVARRCDQLAVMSYDTGLPTAQAYTRYLRWASSALGQLVGSLPARRPTLLMGVPTCKEPSRSHRPSAETPGAALQGLAADPTSLRGVAIYVEHTTTAEDWALLPR